MPLITYIFLTIKTLRAEQKFILFLVSYQSKLNRSTHFMHDVKSLTFM